MAVSVRWPRPLELVWIARSLLEQAGERLDEQAAANPDDRALWRAVNRALRALPDPHEDDDDEPPHAALA